MDILNKAKRVTRNDVAKLAGVSPAVVSYVINSSKFVSEEKKRAVEAAISELKYRPNIQARSLRTNRSMQIAFVCDNLRNDWLEEAETRLFESGYYVSHCYSRDGDDFIQMLISRGFDGVFMMSNRFNTAQINELADAGLPVVLFRTRNYGELRKSVVTVVPDYRDGIAQSINYLVLKGHNNIALLPPIRYITKGLGDDDFRVSAYVEALERQGIEPAPELICTRTDSINDMMAEVFRMLVDLPKEKRPTAVICGNDYIAAKVIAYVGKMGIKVPDDLAVCGTDNTYLSTLMTPPLTTVDFSKDEFAEIITDTMLGLIRGEEPSDVYLKVNVVVRESA